MRTTIPSPFDPLNNNPGSLPRLAREFRAASSLTLQSVSPACHQMYARLCDAVDALSPFAPLDFSLKNGLCYAIRAFLARLGELKAAWSQGAVDRSLRTASSGIESKTGSGEKRLKDDQQLVEKLEYMDALLSAHAQRVPKWRIPEEPATLTVQKAHFAFGSHGTVFFEGSYGKQRVVVKRMSKHFFVLNVQELKRLQDAAPHPNLVRYYHVKENFDFYSIALDFCPVSLVNVIKEPQQHPCLFASLDPKQALREVTSAVQHLHALGIVHCNIHARNVLISETKDDAGGNAVRMLVTDFCTYESMDLSTRTGGWRERWSAPEVFRGEVQLVGGPHDASTEGQPENEGTGGPSRFASIDIFSLGCLFYYVLSGGGNPFGMFYELVSNICANRYSLEGLDQGREDTCHAEDLVHWMLKQEASDRPSADQCLQHCFFRRDPVNNVAKAQAGSKPESIADDDDTLVGSEEHSESGEQTDVSCA